MKIKNSNFFYLNYLKTYTPNSTEMEKQGLIELNGNFFLWHLNHLYFVLLFLPAWERLASALFCFEIQIPYFGTRCYWLLLAYLRLKFVLSKFSSDIDGRKLVQHTNPFLEVVWENKGPEMVQRYYKLTQEHWDCTTWRIGDCLDCSLDT